MKKAFLTIAGGVVAVEVILALYKVPIASAPLMLAVAVAALALWLMVRVLFAVLRDRDRERKAFLQISRQQALTYNASLSLVGQVTSQQAALVGQALAMGATLAQAQGHYYAQLPTGQTFPVDASEAGYWQMVAPHSVALLPTGKEGRGHVKQ